MKFNRVRIYFRHGDVNSVAQRFMQNFSKYRKIAALGVGVFAENDVRAVLCSRQHVVMAHFASQVAA